MDCIFFTKEFADALNLALNSLSVISLTLFLSSWRKKGSSFRGSLLSGAQKGRIGREGSIGGQDDCLRVGVTFDVVSVTAAEEAAQAGAAFVEV